jgi:hypothetical protein
MKLVMLRPSKRSPRTYRLYRQRGNSAAYLFVPVFDVISSQSVPRSDISNPSVISAPKDALCGVARYVCKTWVAGRAAIGLAGRFEFGTATTRQDNACCRPPIASLHGLNLRHRLSTGSPLCARFLLSLTVLPCLMNEGSNRIPHICTLRSTAPQTFSFS